MKEEAGGWRCSSPVLQRNTGRPEAGAAHRRRELRPRGSRDGGGDAVQHKRRCDPVELVGGGAAMERSPAAPGAALQRSPAGCRAAVQRSVLQWSSPALSVQHKRCYDPVELAGCGAAMELSPPPPDVVLPPASVEAASLAAPMDLAGRRSRSCSAALDAPMELSPAAPIATLQRSSASSKLQCSSSVPQWSSRRRLLVLQWSLAGGSWSCDAAADSGSGVAKCFAGGSRDAFAAAAALTGIEVGVMASVR